MILKLQPLQVKKISLQSLQKQDNHSQKSDIDSTIAGSSSSLKDQRWPISVKIRIYQYLDRYTIIGAIAKLQKEDRSLIKTNRKLFRHQ
ncbi:hypothetical protein FGO68_gene15748 [Halteria grandinella]|uniref:Uncharacterized protein n=1 Tax=Halteria grandinella TaxID=5974 RepID=A0A8J8T2S1_HALGN|nr:hypothetical protein FGO68_gene15748 [Halteria grandinella]